MRSYLTLYTRPGAARFSAAAFVGRLPMSMIGLGIVLLLEAVTGSYAIAGAVSATTALAQSAAAPLVGRLVDSFGQGRVLRPVLAVHVAGLLGLLTAAAVEAPAWLFFLPALAIGGAFPPLSSLVRTRWTNTLGDPRAVESAFALESVLDEVVFIAGPVLVTVLAVTVSPLLGLGVALAFVSTGTLAFAALRETEPPVRRQRGPRGLGAIAVPGMRVLGVAFLAIGTVFGALEVTMVAFAEEQGRPGAAGPLLALLAAGSVVGGLWYGARGWRAGLHRRFLVATTVLAVGLSPLPVVPGLAVMAVAITIAGFAIAPTLITGYGLIERLVPAGTLTEGMAWLPGALGVGVAGGSALAGWVIDRAGSGSAFLVAVGGGVAAAGVSAGANRWLAVPPAAGLEPVIATG